MPVMVVEDRSNGHRSAQFLMEGFGRALVFGAYDAQWLRPAAVGSGTAWAHPGPRHPGARWTRLARHHRRIAGAGDETAQPQPRGDLAVRESHRARSARHAPNSHEHRRIVAFLADNVQFFVCVVLPAMQLMLRAADGIPGCSVVTGVGGNGTSCGIRLSGLGPAGSSLPATCRRRSAGRVEPTDVAPGCGDSFLVECAGLGASVLPAAPALTPALGVSLADASRFAEGAYRIALGEHPPLRRTGARFPGAPVGVDARRVVETGTRPVIDIVMGHRTRAWHGRHGSREPANGLLRGSGAGARCEACVDKSAREKRDETSATDLRCRRCGNHVLMGWLVG